ncbi:hypothetical protein N9595_05420 [Bacteroidia bacterium]|nr:hypothetical protein [Bacteroidia bacterium]
MKQDNIKKNPSEDLNDVGIANLNSYYSALNFCSENLSRKLENNNLDFDFEEELLNKVLENFGLFDFARLDTLFSLGNAYYEASQFDKMELIFKRILSEEYSLSPETVARYYRSIGYIYRTQ